MTTVSPLILHGNSESSDRRTTPTKRRTNTPSTGYEPKMEWWFLRQRPDEQESTSMAAIL
eukprot:1551176-Amphidinium_carterae.1